MKLFVDILKSVRPVIDGTHSKYVICIAFEYTVFIV